MRATDERSDPGEGAASPIRVLVTAVPRFISIPPSFLSLLTSCLFVSGEGLTACSLSHFSLICPTHSRVFIHGKNYQYLTKNGINQIRGMAAEYAVSATHDELAFKCPIGQHTQIP